MPFCTNCGADVPGAFCSQCGTPVAGAAASAPPPPPNAAPYSPAAPAPVVRKTSPLVWVLVIILGLFVLGGIGIFGIGAYLVHRVHRAGIAFDRSHDGGITLQARDRDGKNAVVEIGGKGKLPSWVPVYPGSESRSTFSIRGTGDNGEGGNFTFTTPDDPDRVKSFYADKIRDLDMKVSVDTSTPDGGMIVAAEEGGGQRSLSIVVAGHSRETAVNVTYGRK